MTKDEMSTALAREAISAPPIKMEIDAVIALRLVGLLQLALRHPRTEPYDEDLVRQFTKQLEPIGPAFREAIEMGFNREFDQ